MWGNAMVELSEATWEKVRKLFNEDLQQAASEVLEWECADNLPLYAMTDSVRLERVRFAALKVSGGDVEKLRKAVALANRDWRDLLMAAGFGQLEAHKHWQP
jgi:hypothetical protein